MTTIHVGPRFYGINFWDQAGGGRCIYLRNVNRVGFDACAFRGPAIGSGITPSTALVYGWSDSTSTGGTIASADCSWNWFDHCTWHGRFEKALHANPMGFTLIGGEMTADLAVAGNTGIYGFGYHARAFGVKIDATIPLDWCGNGGEFHLFMEANGENTPVRLGQRAANIDPAAATVSDNNETWGNTVRGHLTGKSTPSGVSPVGAILFGPRSVAHNDVDLSISSVTAPLVSEDALVAGRNSYGFRRRTEVQRVEQYYAASTTEFQRIIRARGGGPRYGLLVTMNGSDATGVPFAIESQHGSAGSYSRTAEAFSNGTFRIPRHFSHGTASGTAPTLGFYGVTPVVRPLANADTSGVTLAALETEVNELKATLRSLGLLT